MDINLPIYGHQQAIKPNLAIALDIISIWGSSPSRAHVGRLCAAAMGVCCKGLKMPPYSMIDADPISYGGRCLGIILGKGVQVSAIYDEGIKVLIWLADQLTTEAGVQENIDFLAHGGGS